jgi:hypothetical protein
VPYCRDMPARKGPTAEDAAAEVLAANGGKVLAGPWTSRSADRGGGELGASRMTAQIMKVFGVS